MSNIIKFISKSNDIYYQPNKTHYGVNKYVKAIIYPNLVKNINSNPSINSNLININGSQYLMDEGYYQFGDLIALFNEVFLKAGTNVEFIVNGPNVYNIVNSGSDSVTFTLNNSLKVLLGLNNNSVTLDPGQTIGSFNMNISLGADVIEIYVSGIDNTYVVPILGDYLGKISFYPSSRFLFCLANQPFKDASMRVDYVAIGASEELKTPVNNRIIFSVE